MMKKIIMLLPVCLLMSFAIQAQTEKKTEKKVVIVKKKIDKDGKEVKERIETSGEEADELIKKMKKDGEFEDIDIEITDGKVISKSTSNSTSKSISKSNNNGKEKTVEVEVNSDGGENEYTITIKENGDDDVKVMKWKGKSEDVPADMKKYIDGDGIEIRVTKDGEGNDEDMIFMIDGKDDSKGLNVPKFDVRMGLRFKTHGVLTVMDVDVDSPALKAGLKKGDIITEMDDYDVSTYAKLASKLASKKAGDKVNIRYIRAGKAMTTSLKLESK